MQRVGRQLAVIDFKSPTILISWLERIVNKKIGVQGYSELKSRTIAESVHQQQYKPQPVRVLVWLIRNRRLDTSRLRKINLLGAHGCTTKRASGKYRGLVHFLRRAGTSTSKILA